MPRMDQAPDSERLIKLLAIGDGKIGKTHYAGMAALAGFNVLYMDGDVAGQTLGTLPIEAQRRIYLLPVGDTVMGGTRDYKFIENFSAFATESTFMWNDTQQRVATKKDTGDERWAIRPGAMGPDTIFVLDSWTSLSESIMLKAAIANGVFIESATTAQMRPVYQSSGLMATSALQLIRALRCHVIVIAHPDEFVHTTKKEGAKMNEASREAELTVDWTKMIPKSTSKPHGFQMPKYFSDVAWMGISPSGNERRLDFKLKSNRVGGGHFDGDKSVEEYSFANLVRQVGGTAPDPKRPIETPSWLTILPPQTAEEAAEIKAANESKVLDGTKPTAIKGSGMTNIFAKKPVAAQG